MRSIHRLGIICLLLSSVESGCSDQEFTVNLDQPLRVVALDPTGEAEGVRIDTVVRATFSEPVVALSVNAQSFYLEQLADDDTTTPVDATVELDAATMTAALRPKDLLAYSARYRVVITTAIERARTPAATLPVEVRSTFTVVHPPAFRLVAFNPAPGSNSAAVDATLEAVFNQPVAAPTVSASSFAVADADTGETITGQLTVADTIIEFVPEAPFGYSREIRVNLATTIASTVATPQGGHLEHDLSFVLGTIDPPQLAVVSATPGAGADDVAVDSVFSVLFGEPIDPASATAESVIMEDVTDPIAPVALEAEDDIARLAFSEGNTRITFDPVGHLGFTRSIRVTLKGSADPAAAALCSARATDDGGCLPADVVYEVKTIDPPQLRVVATMPGAGSVGAPIDTAVSVTFGEPVEDFTTDPATVDDHMLIEDLSNPGTPVAIAGTYSLSVDGQTVTFLPDDPLAYATDYRVTLSTLVRSLRATEEGGFLLGDVEYLFRSEEPPPLLLVAVVPSGDGMNVARRTAGETPEPIVLHFSEDVDPTTVGSNVTVVDFQGNAVAGTPAALGDQVTFEPALPLAYSSQYMVTVGAGIASTRGGSLAMSVSFVFDTLDPPPLTLVAATPSDGSQDIVRTEPIVLAFSEGVDQAAIASALVVRDGTGVAVPVTFELGPVAADDPTNIDLIGADTTVTIRPTPPDGGATWPTYLWPYSATIEVGILPNAASDRATDGSGNPTGHRGGLLSRPTTVVFEVVDPPPLLVADRSPDMGSDQIARGQPITVTFTEGVDQATVVLFDGGNDGTSTLFVTDLATGTAIPGTISFNGPDAPSNADLVGVDNRLTFTPATLYAYSENIQVRMTTAIASDRATADGGQLVEPTLAWTFHVQDPPPLLIADRAPSAGAQRVGRAQPIVVTLSEGVDQDSVVLFDGTNAATATLFVTDLSDAPLAGTLSYRGADAPPGTDLIGTDNQLTFSPAGGFWAYSQDIKVRMLSSIASDRATSVSGHLVDPTLTWTFHVEGPPVLYIVATDPGASEVNVPTGATVTVVFNQTIDAATVTDKSVVVRDLTAGGAVVAGARTLNGDGTAIVFKSEVPFQLAHQIEVALSTAICSVIATSESGCLATAITYSFEIVPLPQLRVISTYPMDEAGGIAVTTAVQVRFNLDMVETDLDPAINSGVAVLADVTNPSAPDSTGITVTLASFNHTTLIATYSVDDSASGTPGELVTGTPYLFTVRGGSTGVKATDGGHLLGDYTFGFSTGLSGMIVATRPASGATGVDVGREICAILKEPVAPASVNSTTFRVSFEDKFGRTIFLPALTYEFYVTDTSTLDRLEEDPAFGGTDNEICFVPDDSLFECFTDQRTLLYNEDYAALLTTGISTIGGPLDADFSWRFTTGTPPAIESAYAENDVVKEEPLLGATDVPINSHFDIVFASALIDLGSIELLDVGGTIVPASVGLLADGRTVRVTPSGNLMFGAQYSLVARSGTDGPIVAGGNYLDGEVTWHFTTSPAATVLVALPVSPPSVGVNSLAVVELSRAVHQPSLSSETVYLTIDTSRVPALVSVRSGGQAITLVPAVQLTVNQDHILHLTTGLLDYRGNPLAVGFEHTLHTSNGNDSSNPSLSSTVPSDGGELTAGHASIVMTFNKAMNVSSFVATASDGDSSVELERWTDGGGSFLEQIPARFEYGNASGTSVRMLPAKFLGSGFSYRLVLKREVSDMARNPLSPAPQIRWFGVENDAPTATLTPVHGVTGVLGEAAITAAFAERVDSATVHAASFTLVDMTASSPVAGQVSVATDGLAATFHPLASLRAGHQYTAALSTSVTDTAGIALALTTSTFTVIDSPLVVESLAPADGTTGVVTTTTIVADFDRAFDPATLVAETVAADGTIELYNASAATPAFGCFETDPLDVSRVFFRPVDSLAASTPYTFTVYIGVTDHAGNTIAADTSADWSTAP
ncbi:MAG: Ig-like domain-containing protein [Pseudomonadota bacterium]